MGMWKKQVSVKSSRRNGAMIYRWSGNSTCAKWRVGIKMTLIFNPTKNALLCDFVICGLHFQLLLLKAIYTKWVSTPFTVRHLVSPWTHFCGCREYIKRNLHVCCMQLITQSAHCHVCMQTVAFCMHEVAIHSYTTGILHTWSIHLRLCWRH